LSVGLTSHCRSLGKTVVEEVYRMGTPLNAFKACEEAGCLAAMMGVDREANPYTQAPKGQSCHLLEQESRQRLADAWWKGWERCKKDTNAVA
jgi:hypothetical protein